MIEFLQLAWSFVVGSATLAANVLDIPSAAAGGAFMFLLMLQLRAGRQRKRLALLTAYLEDRPIYLFDEWAADQDPMFKEIFYRTLLPELKRRHKAVVVITHDDRYFDCADRILKLENGQIVEAPKAAVGG